MRKVFILAVVAISFMACRNANNSTTDATTSDSSNKSAIAPANAPIIVFEREVFDFGKLEQGEMVTHEFNFKNTGKSPLIISNATATCGCTVPQIPGEPILPGKDGKIKVVFNSTGKMGMQDKVVTVTSNANPATTTVHLVGEVLTKE
ncbi:DUF1573 domain-containing protein [Pedobacter sandarakinus]|uniref:DUF1573 domain-containing protein n=1 Tax=Pedobacter sandarakinus TaxID=353156 RepID=UPI00224501B8|nr:DUF1573 domain-containing protein [Pedobacter sandarakinus]MCX2575437.1 DUF1573 domain-containing protein [Pedobacter sandarakinus]